MNNDFYERCKTVIAKLDLTYEQGIAREVILNELDNLEKQVEDYQKRFSKAIKYLNEPNRDSFDFSKARLLEILGESNE